MIWSTLTCKSWWRILPCRWSGKLHVNLDGEYRVVGQANFKVDKFVKLASVCARATENTRYCHRHRPGVPELWLMSQYFLHNFITRGANIPESPGWGHVLWEIYADVVTCGGGPKHMLISLQTWFNKAFQRKRKIKYIGYLQSSLQKYHSVWVMDKHYMCEAKTQY